MRVRTFVRLHGTAWPIPAQQPRPRGAPRCRVLGSVVELATRTGALLAAEGIERQSQIAQLVALGIAAGQGYFLGRPGPTSAAAPSFARATDQAVSGVAAWRQSIGLTSVN